MIISSIFIVLHFVFEAFTLLKHLCLCLCLSTLQVLEEVLQAFELSACPMSGPTTNLIVYTTPTAQSLYFCVHFNPVIATRKAFKTWMLYNNNFFIQFML